MTRREIIATLIALTIIGGGIMAGAVYKIVMGNLGWFVIVPISALCGLSYGVFSSFRSAIRELKKRTPRKE